MAKRRDDGGDLGDPSLVLVSDQNPKVRRILIHSLQYRGFPLRGNRLFCLVRSTAQALTRTGRIDAVQHNPWRRSSVRRRAAHRARMVAFIGSSRIDPDVVAELFICDAQL